MRSRLASILKIVLLSVICMNLAVNVGYAKRKKRKRSKADSEYVNAAAKESGKLFDDLSRPDGDVGNVKVELGTGKHEHVDVDFQRVRFPHRDHQRRLLARFMGDKEKACRWCHMKKRKGRDPRACRRCHAGRRVKSKGGEELLPEQAFMKKRLRKGKPMRMKDVFHAMCRGCHFHEREKDLELAAQDKRAPIYCEGCHVRR